MPPFAGTDRYRPVRALGEGGMGQVWEVHDTLADRRVALKALRAADPLALYLFKNEFRALADVAHPHLVGLYDLGIGADGPFFTMELVEGAVDLLRFFRGEAHSSGRSWLTAGGDLDPDATLPPQRLDSLDDAPGELSAPSPLAAARLALVPEILGQLAEGLAALHAARRLHRDVKPSNVLVTPDRRVVLVDFGLVASMEPEHIAHRGLIAGSVPYMSPEQSLGAELTPASDWYALGAVLYELLTGRPPFAGARAAVLAAKRGREVVPPSLVVPGVPDDLDRLCVALLALDPEARPTGAQVLHALGRPVPPERRQRVRLVGREPHLARLESAFERLREGRPATVHLRGPSGMGKSALLSHALEGLRKAPGTLVLSSRCYERDHVPFKAIDPLIDALVPWLVGRSREEQVALAPRHVRALTRLFPVLERIEPFVEAGAQTVRARDPHEEQRRAFDALRELLARVGDRMQLVAAIDDLQWADRDSAEILRGLFRPPDPPAMLLLLAYRTEALESSLALRWLEAPEEEDVVVVEPLPEAHAGEVVRAVLGAAHPEVVDRIVAEAHGSPFFLTELAHQARQEPDGELGLDALIRARVDELPDDARRLLQAVALASVPIARGVAIEAAGGATPTAVTALQSGRLVRSEGPAATDRLECYHDRIRESVVNDLGQAAGLHRALAEALERAGGADPELLCSHLVRAGEPRRAIRYAREAASEALEALAFDRAASNLRVLLELLGPESDERGIVLVRLGDALNNAGRGYEAAEARLAAAPLVRDDSLRLKAAVNLLWSGHLLRGRNLMVECLAQAGIPLPRTSWGMRLQGLWHRLRSRLTPLRFRPRPRGEIEQRELEQAARLADVGFSIVISDQDLAFVTLARFVTLALRLGDPATFVRAMAAESFIAHLEPWGAERGARAYALAEALASQVDDPLAVIWLHQFQGITCIQRGDMKGAAVQLERAVDLLAAVPDSVMWSGWCRLFLSIIQGHRSSWDDAAQRMYQVINDADARSDLGLEVHAVLGSYVHPGLILDDPELARAHAERVFAKWQQDDFDLMHFYAHVMRLLVCAYRQDYAAGIALLREVDDAMRRSGALNSGANIGQLAGVTAIHTAGAIQRGIATPADVRRARRRIDGEMRSRGWRRALAAWSGSALYTALGDRAHATELLDLGIEASEAEELSNLTLLLRAQRLRVLHRPADDPELVGLLERAREAGLRNPLRFLDAYGPILSPSEGLQSLA